jgi:hypothetical protein
MALGDDITGAAADNAVPNKCVPGTAGLPLPTIATGTDPAAAELNSRRLPAATTHADGAGLPPLPPLPPPTSHANTPEPKPLTEPDAAARAGALDADADAAAGRGAIRVTEATTADETDSEPGMDASIGSGSTVARRSSDCDSTPGYGLTPLAPALPDTGAPTRP